MKFFSEFDFFAPLLVLGFVVSVPAYSAKPAELTADALVEKYDSIMGPENFESTAKMIAKREDGTTRNYEMRFVKKGTDKFRIWFKGPAAFTCRDGM